MWILIDGRHILKRIPLVLLALCLVGCPPVGGGEGEGEGEGEGGEHAAMEEDTLAAINAERADEGVSALSMDEPLRAVARAHSEDMLARDFFAHNNPEGESPFDRMDAAGIVYGTAGENIAWNNFPDPVETAVTGWMNSPGHRNNILNGAFTETGLGIAGNDSDGYYFTQAFMGPGGKLLLLTHPAELLPVPLAESYGAGD